MMRVKQRYPFDNIHVYIVFYIKPVDSDKYVNYFDLVPQFEKWSHVSDISLNDNILG